jgi:ferric-dicitrate binding protein FerR (iron transport regulator)
MDTSATYYETLITRYLSGEASPQELAELSAWVGSADENLSLFSEYRKSWSLLEAAQIDSNVDVDSEWDALTKRIDLEEETPEREHRITPLRRLMRVAAVLLIFILPAMFYYWNYMRTVEEALVAEANIIESTLSDGTMVALNAGSILQYPSHFNGKERNVSLEGEAFFDVTHNEEKAFVITADKLQVRVLGTSFYVNTRSSDNTMEVVLISGEVRLEYMDKQMLLLPGEKAVVLEDYGEIVKKHNDDPNFIAWKTKKLRFKDTPLSEIIKVLKKVYHKDIVILNPEILNCRITATFDGQSLEAVLNVLQSTIDIKAKPNGPVIEISGTGCQ